MKRPSPYKAVTLVLASLLVATTMLRHATADETPDPKPPPEEAAMTLGMLEVAKGQLFRVPPVSAGHRNKALGATNEAIREVRLIVFGKESSEK